MKRAVLAKLRVDSPLHGSLVRGHHTGNVGVAPSPAGAVQRPALGDKVCGRRRGSPLKQASHDGARGVSHRAGGVA